MLVFLIVRMNIVISDGVLRTENKEIKESLEEEVHDFVKRGVWIKSLIQR